MLNDISAVFKSLNPRDFRVMTGIEVGMKHYEWVPLSEISKYTKITESELNYILKGLGIKGLLKQQTQPYEKNIHHYGHRNRSCRRIVSGSVHLCSA